MTWKRQNFIKRKTMLGYYLAGLIEGDGSIIVPKTIRNQKGKNVGSADSYFIKKTDIFYIYKKRQFRLRFFFRAPPALLFLYYKKIKKKISGLRRSAPPPLFRTKWKRGVKNILLFWRLVQIKSSLRTGFSDGEACFSIEITEVKGYNIGWRITPIFSLALGLMTWL